ncbi:PAAR domain-containing protein [Sorangium sp. So ce128]|uniref:PAAR domain-containing protein n=1 Tax=Sorangium sp. So ce128 TaxID=3133281 RepID=UPI003F609ADE
MPAAARLTDLHTCQTHPGPTPIVSSARTVNIGFLPAARVGDRAACPASAAIVQGSATVFIEGAMAARLGDETAPKGAIVTGCPTVNIGSTATIDALLAASVSGTPFLDCESCRMDGAG